MSWKRVDVSFKGHIHGFLAHNHIQVRSPAASGPRRPTKPQDTQPSAPLASRDWGGCSLLQMPCRPLQGLDLGFGLHARV